MARLLDNKGEVVNPNLLVSLLEFMVPFIKVYVKNDKASGSQTSHQVPVTQHRNNNVRFTGSKNKQTLN